MPADKEHFDVLSMRQLAELLVKHHGVHSGVYEAAPEIVFGAGVVAGDGDAPHLPGMLVGVKGIRLQKATTKDSPWAVDASEVNPKRIGKDKRGGG